MSCHSWLSPRIEFPLFSKKIVEVGSACISQLAAGPVTRILRQQLHIADQIQRLIRRKGAPEVFEACSDVRMLGDGRR